MTIRFYLSRWIDISGVDEPPHFTPEIGEVIERSRAQWRATDLRTAEEQLKAMGWCLVEADVSDAVHTQAQNVGGVPIEPGTASKDDLESRIGSEGLPATVDLKDAESVRKVALDAHKSRVDRWKGRGLK